MNRDRCFDCLTAIKPTDRHFAVLKPLPGSSEDDDEALRRREHFGGMSQECVCADCAGWYSDAIELPEVE